MFSSGIGFRILMVLFCVRGSWRANRVFGGICSVTGAWSEFRLWLLSVVEVYKSELGAFIQYPSMRLV